MKFKKGDIITISSIDAWGNTWYSENEEYLIVEIHPFDGYSDMLVLDKNIVNNENKISPNKVLTKYCKLSKYLKYSRKLKIEKLNG